MIPTLSLRDKGGAPGGLTVGDRNAGPSTPAGRPGDPPPLRMTNPKDAKVARYGLRAVKVRMEPESSGRKSVSPAAVR